MISKHSKLWFCVFTRPYSDIFSLFLFGKQFLPLSSVQKHIYPRMSARNLTGCTFAHVDFIVLRMGVGLFSKTTFSSNRILYLFFLFVSKLLKPSGQLYVNLFSFYCSLCWHFINISIILRIHLK